MGKGGTKFDGEAVGVRSGRYKGFTAKDRIKDLEEFKRTGRHPEIEEVRARAAKEMLHPLPDVDLARPRTFFDFSTNGRDLGRVVVEVFIDMVPLAARTFVNRCRPGSTGSFEGTAVHKALRGLAVYAGLSRKFVVGVPLRPSPYLRHVESGTVSISATGQELAFGLARSLTLDATHLVIGRVQSGHEVLSEIVSFGAGVDDEPLEPVTILRCGLATARGIPDDEGNVDRSKETAEETAARLQRESAQAQAEVNLSAVLQWRRAALESGLSHKDQKRKAPDDNVSAIAAAADGPKLKGGRFDTLGNVSSDDSSDSQ